MSADVTETLSGSAAIPAESITIPSQTIQATISITIPAQVIKIAAGSAPVSVTLDETTLAAQIEALIGSGSGTKVTTVGPSITDSSGAVWSLVANANAAIGNQVAVNGKVDTTTRGVTSLFYVQAAAGLPWYIYQLNVAGIYYQWINNGWTQVATLP